MTDVIIRQQNVKLNDIQENRYLMILDVIMELKLKNVLLLYLPSLKDKLIG